MYLKFYIEGDYYILERVSHGEGFLIPDSVIFGGHMDPAEVFDTYLDAYVEWYGLGRVEYDGIENPIFLDMITSDDSFEKTYRWPRGERIAWDMSNVEIYYG